MLQTGEMRTRFARVQVLADLLAAGIVGEALIDIGAGAVVCKIKLQPSPAQHVQQTERCIPCTGR